MSRKGLPIHRRPKPKEGLRTSLAHEGPPWSPWPSLGAFGAVPVWCVWAFMHSPDLVASSCGRIRGGDGAVGEEAPVCHPSVCKVIRLGPNKRISILFKGAPLSCISEFPINKPISKLLEDRIRIPLFFLGIGVYRAWIEIMSTNPPAALASTSVLGGGVSDAIYALCLLSVAVFAPRIAPLSERRWILGIRPRLR